MTLAALLLDGIDGQVARRTATASSLGARFDGEVDALLILVLSVYVSLDFGWWVFTMGALRYAFAIAGWILPWMRGQLPPRFWRKVVTAYTGIALLIAAADNMPRAAVTAALLGALGLLFESFGRDVWWLWRHRAELQPEVRNSTSQRRPERLRTSSP
jgi:phosphatidylglycerophosphate synthase